MKLEKRSLHFLLGMALILLQLNAWGRDPATTSYDVQLMNPAGKPLVSESVNIRVSLSTQSEGEAAYSEVHRTNTDQTGKASILIGSGKAIKGDFKQVDLATGSYFVKIEFGMAIAGTYRLHSNSRLLSVTRVQKWLFGKEKFNAVLTIILVIWVGIIVYLLVTSRRISRLEKEMKNLKQ